MGDTWWGMAQKGAMPWKESHRMHLRANFVSSLDGAVEIDGQSKALSSDSDSRVFSMIRRLADVVLVGAGTIRHST